MTPKRLRQIKALARQWREIASDDEAAPTGSMLKVINELILAVESQEGDYNKPGDYEKALRTVKQPIKK